LDIQEKSLKNRLYTIGYSPFTDERFMEVLRHHGIGAVCDVRSMPYSRYKPEFNKAALEQNLQRQSIGYLFVGTMLGGRPAEPDLYEGGRVRFDLVAQSRVFQKGLAWLKQTAKAQTAALMCAEKDPLTCHRTILVCRHLRHEFDIFHILEDGTVEDHKDAERRLVKLVGIPTDDLFRTEEELISDAYDLQGRKIAYVRKE
jgi:uncharacterized protein (DUF488 family)